MLVDTELVTPFDILFWRTLTITHCSQRSRVFPRRTTSGGISSPSSLAVKRTTWLTCNSRRYSVAPSNLEDLTSAIIRVSYDGGRFTGWSCANDDDTDINANSNNNNQLTGPLMLDSPKRRRRRNKYLHSAGTNSSKRGFVRSVQGVIAACLAKLYGNVPPNQIVVEGCSRTDKGVHATGNLALIYCRKSGNNNSTDINKRHPNNATDSWDFEPLPMKGDLSKIAYTLNRMLPWDVRVSGIAPTPTISTTQQSSSSFPGFHPTLSATAKTYEYTISFGPIADPTLWRRVWHVSNSVELDLAAVQGVASNILLGTHDFAAFQGAPRGPHDKRKRQTQTTTCSIHSITMEPITSIPSSICDEWYAKTGTQTIRMVVTGDRFLYKMVRFLVGTLIAVGTHKLTQDDVQDMLETGKRTKAFECAPAHGLVLAKVHYEGIPIDWQPVRK